jgi:hypothetical protein
MGGPRSTMQVFNPTVHTLVKILQDMNHVQLCSHILLYVDSWVYDLYAIISHLFLSIQDLLPSLHNGHPNPTPSVRPRLGRDP